MYMKKTIVTLMSVLFVALTANAQMTDKPTGKGSFTQRVTNLWNKSKETVEGVVDQVREGIDPNGLRRIKGTYYLCIYSDDKYSGAEASQLKLLCRKEFVEKYPGVTVVSVVIPASEWTTASLEKNGETTGFVQDISCYVLAKDGTDGYVNAKFLFERQKNVGEEYQKIDVKWPLWVRTDVLTPEIYERLKK